MVLKELNFKKTKDMMQYADQMFDLFNESYAELSSFVKITDIQKDLYEKEVFEFYQPGIYQICRQ